MIIGHQENTLDKGRIDLLAIAPDASLILIELKRDRTPREVVAQALDYASWVDDLTADRLSQIYEKFSGGGNLGEAFKQRFNTELEEESINQSHQIIIVAAELDPSTERIVDYLSKNGISDLQLLIKTNGKRVWQYRYFRPFTQRRAKLTFGPSPEVTLADAQRNYLAPKQALSPAWVSLLGRPGIGLSAISVTPVSTYPEAFLPCLA